MNIELDEVVELDVSDDVLELAAGGAQGASDEFRLPMSMVVVAGCSFDL